MDITNKELREVISHYLELKGLEKEYTYRRKLHPFFNQIMDGVFASLHITKYERRDYYDLRQECVLKLLTVIVDSKTLGKVKNIRSFCFITARNSIIDNIRKDNNYKKVIDLTEISIDGELQDNFVSF